MHRGYVRLWQKIIESSTWRMRHEDIRVWIYCLVRAARRDATISVNETRVDIKRGQLAVSLRDMAVDCVMSIQTLRTSLDNLTESKNISRTTTNRYTILNLMKFEFYNPISRRATHKLTQGTNTQTNTLNTVGGDVKTNTQTNTGNQHTNQHTFPYSRELETVYRECANAHIKAPTVYQALVFFYKKLERVPLSDKHWDKTYFPRYMKVVSKLLKYFGNPDEVISCILWVKKEMEKNRLSWNLNTVDKWASKFKYRAHKEAIDDWEYKQMQEKASANG